MPQTVDFVLRTEFIALDALLKANGIAHSGGAAKIMINEGQVKVDSKVETRRTCKIRPGQVVEAEGHRVQVLPAAGTGDDLSA